MSDSDSPNDPQKVVRKRLIRPDHSRSEISRREFLAQGYRDFAAAAVMPSMLGLMAAARTGEAAVTCAAPGVQGGLPPFLVFDMDGGGALMGNWVPLDKGGSTLPSYSALGLSPGGTAPPLYTAFGAPMGGVNGQTVQLSKILEGILATTTPEARAVLRMGTIAHHGISDSGDNPHSALMHIAKIGYQGLYVRSPLGSTSRRSGGNSDVGIYDPTLRPLEIDSYTDLANAVNYGPALSNLPASHLNALAKATLNLSKSQLLKLASMSLGQAFSALVECGLIRNQQFTTSTTGLDPRQEAIFQSIYQIAANTAAGNRDVQMATIVMNVLKGNSGPGVITIGDCDYHKPSTNGDERDLVTGREIGRAVQAAFTMGKTLVFQVLTDGGIDSTPNTRIWDGDANGKSLTVVGVVRPAGAPSMSRIQIGHYTAGQEAAGDTLLGRNSRGVAAAVFANYLTIAGQINRFESLVPREILDPNKLSEVLLFG